MKYFKMVFYDVFLQRLDTYCRKMSQCCSEAEFEFEDFRASKWI